MPLHTYHPPKTSSYRLGLNSPWSQSDLAPEQIWSLEVPTHKTQRFCANALGQTPQDKPKDPVFNPWRVQAKSHPWCGLDLFCYILWMLNRIRICWIPRLVCQLDLFWGNFCGVSGCTALECQVPLPLGGVLGLPFFLLGDSEHWIVKRWSMFNVGHFTC